MTEVPGIDTILGLVGKPPQTNPIAFKTMKSQQRLIQAWNSSFIAIIPYCYKCREPLVWHISASSNENVLFHCPKCKREWVKGAGW